MGNFFRNLLTSVTSPVRKAAELARITSTANRISNAASRGPSGESGFDELRNYDPRFLDVGETEEILTKPMQSIAKEAARVGSFMVPGSLGTGIGGLIKGGAASGALGGLSETEDFSDIPGVLEDLAKGAAIGGAVGGGLGLAGKGLEKLRARGSSRLDSSMAKTTSRPFDELLDEIELIGDRKPTRSNLNRLEQIRNKMPVDQRGQVDFVIKEFDDALGGIGSRPDLAQNLRRSVFKGVDTSKTGLKPKVLANAQDTLIDKFIEKTGNKTFTGADLANVADDLTRELNDELIQFADKIPARGSSTKLMAELSPFRDKLNSMAYGKGGTIKNAYADDLIKTLNSINDSATVGDLVRANRSAIKAAGGFKRATSEGAGDALSVVNSIKKAIRGEIADIAPEVSGPLMDVSSVIEVADSIVPAVSKQTKAGVGGAVLSGASANIRPFAEKAATTGARFLEGGSGLAGGLGDLLAGLAPQEGGRIAGVVGRAAPYATPVGVQGILGQPDMIDELGGYDRTTRTGGYESPVGMDFITALGMAQQIFPNGSETELMKLAGMLQEESAPEEQGGLEATTDLGRKALVARNSAIDALSTIKQSPSSAGKTQGIENFFLELTGQANDATKFKSQLETMRTLVMTALGGATLPPGEIKRFEQFLPKVTDSAGRIEEKLTMLIPQLESLVGGGSTQEYGNEQDDYGDLNSIFY